MHLLSQLLTRRGAGFTLVIHIGPVVCNGIHSGRAVS